MKMDATSEGGAHHKQLMMKIQQHHLQRIIFGYVLIAPAFIILLGDSRVRKYCPFPIMQTDDDKWVRTYLSSLAISYQYMALAATSMGLGSQWVSSIHLPGVPEQIREIIGIPEEMIFFDMFVVGYPDMTPPPKKMRPLDEMLHFDACGTGDFRTEKQLKAYFGIK